MRQYELTYLISDDVPESEITKVTGKIGGMIADEKGKVLKEESWGRRKLAYPIKKLLFATYVTINFELEPENLKNISRELIHESSIIRYLLIVKKSQKEKLSLTAEDVATTDEIEQVVGGEKSFESILGETDESKDLMAVRGETEELKDEETKEQKNDKKEKEEIKPETIEESLAVKPLAKKEEKPAKITKTPTVNKLKPINKTEKAEVKAEEPKDPATIKKKEIKQEKTVAKSEEKKPIKKKAIKKDSTVSDETDRLAKLDEKLNDILGEEL